MTPEIYDVSHLQLYAIPGNLDVNVTMIMSPHSANEEKVRTQCALADS